MKLEWGDKNDEWTTEKKKKNAEQQRSGKVFVFK